MRLAYRFGMAGVIVWLAWLLYALNTIPSELADGEIGLIMLVGAAGLVLFPLYFIVVWLVYYVRERRQPQEKRS
ncbi:hypothetical protein [Brevibacillus dissolubilis]|uniref:hypothetical protein n=1 Tax=Brevibacillus dissolubilis TaxID=1844116 RepID=UPI00111610B7|nr:hypothetical protein [Brevibacillus dissolubilis]